MRQFGGLCKFMLSYVLMPDPSPRVSLWPADLPSAHPFCFRTVHPEGPAQVRLCEGTNQSGGRKARPGPWLHFLGMERMGILTNASGQAVRGSAVEGCFFQTAEGPGWHFICLLPLMKPRYPRISYRWLALPAV